MIKFNRAQAIFGVVAIVAVFGVYKLNGFLSVLANGGPKLSADVSASYNPADDPDADPNHDGLTNAEDIVWGIDPLGPNTNSQGFIYGAEVAAGRNPITGQPLSDTNLTDQISNLTADGLYAGALNPASDSYAQSISDMADAVADSAQYAFNQTVDPSSLNIIGSNGQTDTEYLRQAGPMLQQFSQLLGQQFAHIETNLNTIGTNGYSDPSITTFFSAQASAYQALLQTGTAMSVPSDFQDNHAQFLTLVTQMQEMSDAITNGNTDPVKASVALNVLGNMPQNYLDLITDYKAQIEKVNLDPTVINTIFK